MALSWSFLVAILAGFAVAQANNDTSTAGTTSSRPTSVSTKGTAATTTAGPSGFYTFLNVSFESNRCCSEADEDLLNSKFESFFKDELFNLMGMDIYTDAQAGTCHFKVNFTFGPSLRKYDITEILEDKLKSHDYTFDTLELTDVTTDVYVPGVTTGEWTVSAEDCKNKCCGTGGKITLKRDCLPINKCRSYKLSKVESDCMNVCPKECSGVIVCKISLLVLLCGAFMNWFLK